MLVIGDSIALGTGTALHVETRARVGAPSCEILRKVPGGRYDVVVISAGVNDPPGRCLEAILAPASTPAASFGYCRRFDQQRSRPMWPRLLCEHGDRTVSYVPGPRPSAPRSYSELAHKVRS